MLSISGVDSGAGWLHTYKVIRSHPRPTKAEQRNVAEGTVRGPSDGFERRRIEEGSMTTATATRTDEQIRHDVEEELRWDARLQPNEIGVIVKDGVVTLTG